MGRTPLTLPFDGNLLRSRREEQGWSQEDLAQRCTQLGTPVSRFQVVRAETGRNLPTRPTLQAFARALGLRLEDLLVGGRGTPESSDVESFFFPASGERVRSILRGGAPWFVGRDVCTVLALTNPADALAKGLDDDEKGVAIVYTPGGDQQVAIVNEPGLYSLILRSRKPEAKAFKRWITHEVLPALREKGSFSLTSASVPRTLPEALRAFAAEIEAHEKTKADLAAAQPLAEAYHDLMSKDGTFDWAAVAQIFTGLTGGLGRNSFLSLLRDLEILKANNTPYQRHAKYFKVVGDAVGSDAKATTTVRPPGLDWLRARLMAHFYQQGALFAIGGAA